MRSLKMGNGAIATSLNISPCLTHC